MKFDHFIGSRNGLILAIVLPVFVSLLFPTINSTQDGWGFAADARWGTDLFQAHHLLYTFQLFVFSKILPFYDVLLLGKHLNAIYLGGCLFVLSKILANYSSYTSKTNSIVFFVGSSFAAMRFATENETYIAPVFYSLIGTLFFIKFEDNAKITNLFLAGFFLAFACLMHQIHFFWWLSIVGYLAIKSKAVLDRKVIYFLIPAAIVPCAYALVLVFYRGQPLNWLNTLHFVFESFYTGTSSFLFDVNGIIRFFLSILRSFIQIHSSVFLAIQRFKFLIPLAFSIAILIGYWFFKLIKSLKFKKPDNNDHLYLYLVIIFIQLAFALFCYGNSEMMVMIPFIFGIAIILCLEFRILDLFLFSSTIFAWNLIFGLVFNYQIEFNTNNHLAIKSQLQKTDIFFVRYSTEINNIIYYNTGKYGLNMFYPKCNTPSSLESRIDSMLLNKVNVYTDCVEKGVITNTASLIYDQGCISFFKKYKAIKVDSFSILGQFENLYKLEIDE